MIRSTAILFAMTWLCVALFVHTQASSVASDSKTVATSDLATSEAAPEKIFREHVQPFFATHCIKCHGEKKQKGKVTLHNLPGPDGFTADLKRWEKTLEMLASGEMPPEDQKQPSKVERTKIINWIRANIAATGHRSEWDNKLLYPDYGNYIDHDKLFDSTVKTAAFSPSRLWKKSPDIFQSQLVRGMELGKGRYGRINGNLSKVKQPFNIEDKAGIKDFAAILYADSATLATLMRNGETLVDKHLEGALHALHVSIHGEIPDDQLPKDKRGKIIRPRYQKTLPVFSEIVMQATPPTDQQANAAIAKWFDIVIEREPTPTELDKYCKLMHKCIAASDNAEGLRVALIAVAISPPAVYRMELGDGTKDEHGRQMLSPANLAFAIAYALTDDKPDATLTAAAKNGKLSTREDVAREVTRLWDDDAVEKLRILRFFHEFFGYHRAPGVFKDDARFGRSYGRSGAADMLVQDADTLVNYIVKQDKNVLAELLTTEKFFVAHSGDNAKEKAIVESLNKFYAHLKDENWKDFPYATPKEHAAFARSLGRTFSHPNGNVVKGWMRYLTKCAEHNVTPIPRSNKREFIAAYNLDEKTFDYPVEQPFVLAKGKRVGILSHPAWLIAHSLNLDNDPVRRGKWIRERLLGDTVPELPITVDARIPDEPDQTLRHRFRVTRQEECWRCHVKMNPLGMPFEAFDDFGRFRTVEQLHAKGKSAPVNATGALDNTGDAALDGNVNNHAELMQKLAKSTRVRQTFVRHAFRYWMGRNEMYSDASTLIAADQAYVANGGSFRAMVISLLTSDSFLYRKTIENQP